MVVKRKHSKAPLVITKKLKTESSDAESLSEDNPTESSDSAGDNSDADSDASSDTDNVLEREYVQQIAKATSKKNNRLPIKTQKGLVRPAAEDELPSERSEDEADSDGLEPPDIDEEGEDETPKSVTALEIFSTQSKVLEDKKIQVGSLCAGILENPNEKINNFRTLLNLMHDKEIGNYITIKKLIVVSLAEVFKDLLPEYKIKQNIAKNVRLKKETLKLEKYETSLLQYYKKYLQAIERMSLLVKKKSTNENTVSAAEQSLGELAVAALCELLETHPYFNYAENVAQTVVPFLNSRLTSVREKVADTCKNTFKEDKKGEITLKILQLINQYVKKHGNVYPVTIEVLLALKIREVNLDEQRDNAVKQKKIKARKSNVLQLSKSERKRKARLAELEKELLEAKAEESKQVKQKHIAEITKLAFGLFFRMLKDSKNAKIIDLSLQGISKFAHCINVDFYMDLINILDDLLKADWMSYSGRLRCIQTVFAILGHQGEVLNIDPTRFYSSLYENLLTIHASKHYNDFGVILETLTQSLVKRHKKITLKRAISFAKRTATLSLQVLHNGSLGCLGIVKSMMQLIKAVDILLDMESSPGDGKYMPELGDPEYCNASATALYELVLLSRHYHPTVVEYAKYISEIENEVCHSKFGRSSAEELFELYDMSKMAFHPAVPARKKAEGKPRLKGHHFCDDSFRRHCFERIRNCSV